jgi:hypothetical protein
LAAKHPPETSTTSAAKHPPENATSVAKHPPETPRRQSIRQKHLGGKASAENDHHYGYNNPS